MTPEIYRQAGELFDRLRELPAEEQMLALEAACAGHAELRAQVLRLIEADRDAGGFLEGRAVEDAARLIATPPEAAALPAGGTVIGNYRLGTQIGAGGMGVVYEGQDLHLERRVAVKILPQTFATETKERIRRFQREARAASTLNHPNIVSIFDADFAQGYHYIAMEFVEGNTLRQLAGAPAPPDSQTILEWIGQTASALSAAHEAGIVHRDIKPENIMVRPDGFVKVLDFGLAKLREPTSGAAATSDLRTRPGNLAGTIQYLSPEQILGEPASPRSDLFSLGVVAYEMATGVRPFDGPTDGVVFNAILNRMPPPPSAVRPSLGTELDGLIMRALEKDPDLRFQTAGDLRSSCRRVTRDHIAKAIEKDRESRPANLSAPAAAAIPAQPARSSRRWLLAAVAVFAMAAISAAFWLTRPAPPPRVTRIVQMTTDGQTKQRMVNDGTRLYYSAGIRDPDMKMFQVNLTGGDPVPMPRLTGMLPLDISPDRSEILLGQIPKGAVYEGDTNGPFPLWVADTLGNAPRRLGDLFAQEVRWSPTGDRLLYSNGAELRIARSDGSQSRTVAVVKGVVGYPQWSPDGRSIRFTLVTKTTALWEVAPDGTHLHELFREWADLKPHSGIWTPDGKYFVFVAGQGGARDLWAVRETRRALQTASPIPVRLTQGPMKADLPEASADGRRIFFLGELINGQLVRYDRKSDQWTPYLGGVAAMHLDFSRDGKWIAYVRCPEGSLWRMASDGSERLQLTTPPLFALHPRWSPDGTQIVFYAARPGEPNRLYTVPATGGAVRQLTNGQTGSLEDADGNWSPDGASLVLGASFGDASMDERHRLALEIVDVKTLRVSRLPGSDGLWSPRWSPDGRHIAALAGLGNRLWLYDVETRTPTQLTTIGAGWPSWSRDSEYVYFEDNPGTDWCRVRTKDRKMERVMSLVGLKMAAPSLSWVGLTPDGSPISTRDAGGREIYALDWEAP